MESSFLGNQEPHSKGGSGYYFFHIHQKAGIRYRCRLFRPGLPAGVILFLNQAVLPHMQLHDIPQLGCNEDRRVRTTDQTNHKR